MYINKTKQLVTCLLIVCVLLLGNLPAAYAASADNEPVDSQISHKVFIPFLTSAATNSEQEMWDTAAEMKEREQKYLNAIRQVEQFLTVNQDGTISTNLVNASALDNVDSAIFNDLMQSLEQTNTMLRSGELKLADINLHTGVMSDLVSMAAVNGCNGSNQLLVYWWGGYKNVDSCITGQMVTLLNVASGIARLCSLLVVSATYCGPIATVAKVSATYIKWLNQTWGRGVYFGWTWAGTPWVWHQ